MNRVDFVPGEKPFSVLLFGSHPDDDNDDCWTGADFTTIEEAKACVADPWKHFARAAFESSTAFFVIDGVGMAELIVKPNPAFRPSCDDGEWRRERAMQAGMGGGCESYNEAMGFATREWDDEETDDFLDGRGEP